MRLIARTKTRISKPVKEVFEALVEPRHISQYWTSATSGRLVAGKEIMLEFGDFGFTVQFPIKVEKVVDNELVSFRWEIGDDKSAPWNLVTLTLESLGPNQTSVAVSEDGYTFDEKGIRLFAGQIEGWVHYMSCLKAYMEHGIHLHRNGIVSMASDVD